MGKRPLWHEFLCAGLRWAGCRTTGVSGVSAGLTLDRTRLVVRSSPYTDEGRSVILLLFSAEVGKNVHGHPQLVKETLL